MNRTAAYLLSPDDPRLTAFALGELDGGDYAAIASALRERPELQVVVDEIRRAAEDLTAALAAEPLPDVDPLPLLAGNHSHRNAGKLVAFPARSTPAASAPRLNGSAVARAESRSPLTYAERTATRRGKGRPTLSYFWVMTLSAACFMAVVFVSERRFSAEEQAAAATAAQAAATERARAAARAAAASQRSFLELDLSNREYARASLAERAAETDETGGSSAYLPAGRRPNSSFPIDVATTSYGDVVRAIASKQVPPAGLVRIEEMLNTFAYDYPEPAAGNDAPFAASLEAADAPWNPGHRLVRIGLKGRTSVAGTTATIARNVSIQVEFNPETVRSYRLIGYEKSPLVAQEKLSAGRVDAAEVHAGHTVTALYEVIPVEPITVENDGIGSAAAPPVTDDDATRLLTVRIAYTRPDGVAARPLEFALDDHGAGFGDASGDFKFAAAVAGFGMMLRQPGGNESLTFGSLISWAEQGARNDRTGSRQQFVAVLRDASEFLR